MAVPISAAVNSTSSRSSGTASATGTGSTPSGTGAGAAAAASSSPTSGALSAAGVSLSTILGAVGLVMGALVVSV